MSERKINLEEIIFDHCENEFMDGLVTFDKKYLLKSYLEFGKQLLELAAENAECNFISRDLCNLNQLQHGCIISDNLVVIPNKKSILDTIKQVE